MRFIFGFVFVTFASLFCGCVSIPVERISEQIEVGELSDHVEFLTNRKLKGRKAGSWESVTVRKYLVNRFQAYGLLPWGECDDFKQSFGIGTNIVGVLPGSELSDEVIILSAHYDHLGKTKDGLCLGAGDNASGVAAVLEIAEKLSQSDKPLKRTVCFALFDAEEIGMIGSMVFSLRDDYNDANVVAAVTIDMLGRELFDVVDGSLCIAGAEKYPQLRKATAKTATQNGVKLLPIGSDLIGPRGDHVAFSDDGRMSLFFTCGLFSDYHKPADTADKLDYKKMQGSTKTILQTVTALANSPQIEKPHDIASSYHDELLSLNYILDKLNLRYKEAGLTDKENEKISALAETTRKKLADGDFSGKARRAFVRDVLTALMPMLSLADESLAKNEKYYLWLYVAYLPYIDDMIAEYKKTIGEAMDNKLATLVFGKKFSFNAHVFSDEDMSLILKDDGVYEFDMILSRVKTSCRFGGLLRRKAYVNSGFESYLFGCTGTKNEIVDYCLLLWGLRNDKDLRSFLKTWPKVFKRIDGSSVEETYDERLERRLEAGGFADKNEWVLAMLDSGNSELLVKALGQTSKIERKKVVPKIAAIITDTKLSARARITAIMEIHSKKDRDGFLAIVDVIDDETLYKGGGDSSRFTRESYPLKDHPISCAWNENADPNDVEKEKIKEKKEKRKRELIAKIRKEMKVKKDFVIIGLEDITVGDAALQHLRVFSKKDFKKDKEAWKKRIKEKMPSSDELKPAKCPRGS